MTTAHTPAPWTILNLDANTTAIMANGEALATLSHPHCDDRAETNARLIASAPEMLALLKGLAFIAETVAHTRGLEREILPTTDKARALIAQIEG